MTELVLDRVLDAVLIGAGRNATNSGHVYQPRRVTAKQVRLLKVLVEHEEVGFEELRACFEREWKTICDSHPDRYTLLNKRALFQNLADIAARINASLLAGYSDTVLRKTMAGLLGGSLLGLGYRFDSFAMSLVRAEDLAELRSLVEVVNGKDKAHRRRRKGTPVELPKPAVNQAVPTPPPATPITSSPDPVPQPPRTMPAPFVSVDEVTGRWTVRAGSFTVEIDRRAEYVSTGSHLRRVPLDWLPENPDQLLPEHLERLLELAS